MNLLSEGNAFSIALAPQTLSQSNVTGAPYLSVKDYTRVMAVLQVGAMAAGTTAKLEVFQGAGPAGVGGALLPGATATITANTAVSRATAALVSVLAGQTLTVNGIVFTAHGSVTDVTLRQFSIGGSDTEDSAALVSCINAANGVPGVTASNVAGLVTLVTNGEVTITTVASDSTITCATLSGQAFVEVDNLSLTPGNDSLAVKITSTATGSVSAVWIRSPRVSGAQVVGASAVV